MLRYLFGIVYENMSSMTDVSDFANTANKKWSVPRSA